MAALGAFANEPARLEIMAAITAANLIKMTLWRLVALRVTAQIFAATDVSEERAAASKERGASPVTRAAPRAEAVTNPVDRTACSACLYLWQGPPSICRFHWVEALN